MHWAEEQVEDKEMEKRDYTSKKLTYKRQEEAKGTWKNGRFILLIIFKMTDT